MAGDIVVVISISFWKPADAVFVLTKPIPKQSCYPATMSGFMSGYAMQLS